jgi:hypothetical protein
MGIRRRSDVPKKHFCHICRPNEVRPNCIAHPRFKDRMTSREKCKDFSPALSAVKPLELRRLFSVDLKTRREDAAAVDTEELFRRYAGLYRSQFGKDRQSVIEGLIVITELARTDVQERLEYVLRQMRTYSVSRSGEGGGDATLSSDGKKLQSAVGQVAPESSFGMYPLRPAAGAMTMDVPSSGSSGMHRNATLCEDAPVVTSSAAVGNNNDGHFLTMPSRQTSSGSSEVPGVLCDEASRGGKRVPAKSGTKRPRPASLALIGDDRSSAACASTVGSPLVAIATRNGGFSSSMIREGDDAGLEAMRADIANGRSLSREDRKLFQIMQMFKRMEEQQESRGKKKPRALTGDNDKFGRVDSAQVGGARQLDSQGSHHESGDADDARPSVANVEASVSPPSLKVEVPDVSPTELDGMPRQDGPEQIEHERTRVDHDRDLDSDGDRGRERSRNRVCNLDHDRDRHRDLGRDHEYDRDIVDCCRAKDKVISSKVEGILASVSNRVRHRRRAEIQFSSAPVGNGKVEDGKATLSDTPKVSFERPPVDPALLFRINVPGPSVLRSNLIPASRRSTLENASHRDEAASFVDHGASHSKKKRWIAEALAHTNETLVEEKPRLTALPAKKLWLCHQKEQTDDLQDMVIVGDENEVGSDDMDVIPRSDSSLMDGQVVLPNVEREKISVSMVVVSQRHSLPDHGKQIEASRLKVPVAVHASNFGSDTVVVTLRSTIPAAPEFEDSIRRTVARSRSGSRAECVKKRVTMLFDEEPSCDGQSVVSGEGKPSPLTSPPSPILSLRSVSPTVAASIRAAAESPGNSTIVGAPVPRKQSPVPSSVASARTVTPPQPTAIRSPSVVEDRNVKSSPTLRSASPLRRKRVVSATGESPMSRHGAALASMPSSTRLCLQSTVQDDPHLPAAANVAASAIPLSSIAMDTTVLGGLSRGMPAVDGNETCRSVELSTHGVPRKLPVSPPLPSSALTSTPLPVIARPPEDRIPRHFTPRSGVSISALASSPLPAVSPLPQVSIAESRGASRFPRPNGRASTKGSGNPPLSAGVASSPVPKGPYAANPGDLIGKRVGHGWQSALSPPSMNPGATNPPQSSTIPGARWRNSSFRFGSSVPGPNCSSSVASSGSGSSLAGNSAAIGHYYDDKRHGGASGGGATSGGGISGDKGLPNGSMRDSCQPRANSGFSGGGGGGKWRAYGGGDGAPCRKPGIGDSFGSRNRNAEVAGENGTGGGSSGVVGSAAAATAAWSSFRQRNGWSQKQNSSEPDGSGGIGRRRRGDNLYN